MALWLSGACKGLIPTGTCRSGFVINGASACDFTAGAQAQTVAHCESRRPWASRTRRHRHRRPTANKQTNHTSCPAQRRLLWLHCPTARQVPLSMGTHSLWSTPRHSKSVACRAASRARRLRHTPTVHAAASTAAAAAEADATAAVDAISQPPLGAPAAVGAADARDGRGASECAGASERAGAAVAAAQAHAYFGCASSRQIPQLFSSSDACECPSHTRHTHDTRTHTHTHDTHTHTHTHYHHQSWPLSAKVRFLRIDRPDVSAPQQRSRCADSLPPRPDDADAT